jgi:hypothetical protein
MKTNNRSFALRALAIVATLFAVTAVAFAAMQPDQHALISGVPALLGSVAFFSFAALFVFSGSVPTRFGYEVKKSARPIMFWLLTLLFVLAGFRCIFLVQGA